MHTESKPETPSPSSTLNPKPCTPRSSSQAGKCRTAPTSACSGVGEGEPTTPLALDSGISRVVKHLGG